ncbi:Protein FAM219B [Sciurus carolinensis]|uniref:Protein FAM219B n=1 Tax=Sciurus carolinensis TaxID=30640 RepID=A0AA41N4T9_SCICA|nr:Protein FAM219B [Sciurus carolinensis]
MATEDPGGQARRASAPGPRPGGAPEHASGTVGSPSGRSASGTLRPGDRTPATVEKRGPYMVTRAPSIQAKLQKHRDLAKAVLRRKGMLGSLPNRPDSSGKRSVKFNKGYTALSQSPDENLVSLDSDSDGELESRYSSGYSSAEASPERLSVNQDVSRQLLQDGYHLDEIPDDEDLDLIPPKPMASSTCSCCWCCLGDSSCTLQ